MDSQTSIRWGGDFSLPRFRAKLANRHLLHPDVEPGYLELYRPELGGRTITKRSSAELRMASTSPDFGRARSLGSPTGAALDTILFPRSSSTMLGDTRLAFAETSRSFGSSSMLQPSLSATSSAPLLGLR